MWRSCEEISEPSGISSRNPLPGDPAATAEGLRPPTGSPNMGSSRQRNLGTAGARLSEYAAWIACCLGRGRRAPLVEGDISQLVDHFGESRFASGDFVFCCGDTAAKIHVVHTGTVELSRVINERRVSLQILHAGDVFGDVPAFLGEPEPFDAIALEDSTILSLDSTSLFEMLKTRPHVAQRWILSLAERMAGLQHRLGDLLAGSLEAQLASLLLRESGEDGAVNLTQDQLADMLGVARTSVHRVLKQLEGSGWIELGYGKIDVTDVQGLETLVVLSEA
jgi:CRP-like cAMP-binding protein